MIPKIIHYCWFGRNCLPPLAEKCIASWHKYFPDYEVKEWNEDNFDVNMIPYTKEAYKAKKYAFVSDYARFWILYNYGGLYFDTDVEVIKSFDEILSKGPYMGFERNPDKWGDGLVNPGLGLAAMPQQPLLKEILAKYQNLNFLLSDGSLNISLTVVHYTTQVLEKFGLKQMKGIQTVADFTIYPSEYFAPIDFVTKRIHITDKTLSVHRYMASWGELKDKTVTDYIKHCLPEWCLIWFNRLKYYKR